MIEWVEAEFAVLWPQIVNFATGMTQPIRLAQLAGAILLALLAWGIGRAIGPRFDHWMRSRDLSMSQARMFLTVRKRLGLMAFVIMIWLCVLILREVTWPSHSFFLSQVARLATAWLVVIFASRLIRNPLARTFVRWTVWIIAALSIFGILDQARAYLDQAALQLGENLRISLLLIIQGALVLIVLLTLAGWVARGIVGLIGRSSDISPTMRVLSEKLITIAIYGIAIVAGLQAVGFDLTTLTIFSGAVGLGLGFGLQKVVSNLVSGIILLMDRSIKPGDVISLGETFGWITQLGARYVSVVTRDGREYLIPNEDLITGQVVNWSHSNDLVRLDIYFGTAYESDPHQVRKLAVEAAASVDRVVPENKPVCHIVGFGDSSIDFILRFWIRDPAGGLTNVRGNVFLALWDTLKAHDIEIPFPRRDVTLREPARIISGDQPEDRGLEGA